MDAVPSARTSPCFPRTFFRRRQSASGAPVSRPVRWGPRRRQRRSAGRREGSERSVSGSPGPPCRGRTACLPGPVSSNSRAMSLGPAGQGIRLRPIPWLPAGPAARRRNRLDLAVGGPLKALSPGFQPADRLPPAGVIEYSASQFPDRNRDSDVVVAGGGPALYWVGKKNRPRGTFRGLAMRLTVFPWL